MPRFTLHYESDPEHKPRWWAVVLFYVTLLALLFGVGWWTTTVADLENLPGPAATSGRLTR